MQTLSVSIEAEHPVWQKVSQWRVEGVFSVLSLALASMIGLGLGWCHKPWPGHGQCVTSWPACRVCSQSNEDPLTLLLRPAVICWPTCRPQVTLPTHLSFVCRWTLDFGNVSALFFPSLTVGEFLMMAFFLNRDLKAIFSFSCCQDGIRQ